MPSPQCVITGADLVLENEGTVVHGDLHVVDDAYVFNAVIRDGEAIRKYQDSVILMAGSKLCVKVDGKYCFERRGIFVFSIAHARPNKAAQEHLARIV